MTTEPTSEQRVENTIVYGRACVRIIEAADVLLARNPAWTERLLLRLVRRLYTHRLRGLVAKLPSEITSEILAASEKMLGRRTCNQLEFFSKSRDDVVTQPFSILRGDSKGHCRVIPGPEPKAPCGLANQVTV